MRRPVLSIFHRPVRLTARLLVATAAVMLGRQATAEELGFGASSQSAPSGRPTDLAAVLRSATVAPPIAWTRWQDPTEAAFAADVPAGWAVQGGIVRSAPLDVRTVLQLRSADGAITLRFGDPGVPTFGLPSQLSQQTGIREGQRGAGGYVVRHYETGAQFAHDYGSPAAQQICGGQGRVEHQDLPQLSAPANDAARRAGLPTHNDTGAAMFSCAAGAPPQAVLVVATTSVIPAPAGMGGIWTVPFLAVAIAPAARMAEANAIGTHIARSVAVNPQWQAAQQQSTGQIAEIQRRAADEQFRIQQQIARQRTASMEQQAEQADRTIRGVQQMQAPDSGRRYEVPSGSSYDWIDPNGRAVGTNTPDNPDATRYQMMQSPQR